MPTGAERKVFILDDDYGARESLRWLIESAGHRVETFSRPSEFFAAYDPSQPGLSGARHSHARNERQ